MLLWQIVVIYNLIWNCTDVNLWKAEGTFCHITSWIITFDEAFANINFQPLLFDYIQSLLPPGLNECVSDVHCYLRFIYKA